MNSSEAKQILNKFGSTHEHGMGKYYADFNIKVYHPNIPNNLTELEREYVECVSDPFGAERSDLLFEISAIAPAQITGRSGGWLTVEWNYPVLPTEIVNIAKEIEQINVLVNKSLAYVRSEEFWRGFVEGVDPTASQNYNPKTKIVTSIVMYTDSTFGVVLTLTRGTEDRRFYYHRDGKVSRLLDVLNSDAYDRKVKLGKVSKNLFIYFEKK